MKYKYWSTEKLLNLLKELDYQIKYSSYGMSDIYFRESIENILYKRDN